MKNKINKYYLLFSLIFFSTCFIASVKSSEDSNISLIEECNVCDLNGCSPAGDFQNGGSSCIDLTIPGTKTTACSLFGEECNDTPQQH